jgi:hypothetical protein
MCIEVLQSVQSSTEEDLRLGNRSVAWRSLHHTDHLTFETGETLLSAIEILTGEMRRREIELVAKIDSGVCIADIGYRSSTAPVYGRVPKEFLVQARDGALGNLCM